MSGLPALPKDKWEGTEAEPILLQDFIDIEQGVLETAGSALRTPTLVWVDNTAVKVSATADCPATVMMSGFPNIINPAGQKLGFGVCDKQYRQNTSPVYMDFDTPGNFLGTEKINQWYAVFAIAGNADTTFTLLGIPLIRVKAQVSQTISFGTNITPANAIGYGFAVDSLIGYKILMLSGASKGSVRTITANIYSTTAGSLTYDGTALTVSAGDWLVILPNTNFRWLGDFRNNASSHIEAFYHTGVRVDYNTGVSQSVPEGTIDGTAVLFPPLSRFVSLGIINGAISTIPSGSWPYLVTDGTFNVSNSDGVNPITAACNYYIYADGML